MRTLPPSPVPLAFGAETFHFFQQLVSVIREEIVEEQRGRHGLSQINPVATAAGAGAGGEGDGGGGGEAAIETILMKASVGSGKAAEELQFFSIFFFLVRCFVVWKESE